MFIPFLLHYTTFIKYCRLLFLGFNESTSLESCLIHLSSGCRSFLMKSLLIDGNLSKETSFEVFFLLFKDFFQHSNKKAGDLVKEKLIGWG